MEGGDGWCVERYNNSTVGIAAQDASITSRIMLRFRPIMPKPSTGNPSSYFSRQENNNLKVTAKRSKRKYVRVSKNNNNNNNNHRAKRKKKSAQEETENCSNDTVLTLQLLPERDDKGSSGFDRTVGNMGGPMWWILRDPTALGSMGSVGGADRTAGVERNMVEESWMTVECVTDTCMDGRGLGCTDEEKMSNLENDTCPGLISDDLHEIKWVNKAYRRFVSSAGGGGDGDSTAAMLLPPRLVVKERLPTMFPMFSCRVKLQYNNNNTPNKDNNNKCCVKMVLPCDVWRMDFGGFAWRLDVKAALTLGL